ncbi:hypothetical protein [Halorarum salinum]|uniref:Uncharacterized protein n=1 Tax=Halorarum salinum TaxID=2743089 RepID=A0A7D5LAF5_9EURY|nr:hypothetical protein [Halobaculum salinum]QLG62032.1 hypothetical protein HUG12_09965 [Halobaculum salinum]
MPGDDRLPEPHRTQLRLHQEIAENDIEPLLAVHLHKAKFHQEKAVDEYQSREGPETFLSPGVYEQSAGMVAARTETATSVPVEDAWQEIAAEETWVGALPVQMHRQAQDVYLRGFPFIIGFANGQPRVVLNKILVGNPGNLERVYANEWARPWVIAEILDATGFNTENLFVATMKAEQDQYGDQGLHYLKEVAQRTVGTFVEQPEEPFLKPKTPTDWMPDWQDGHVRTQLLQYETGWSLFDRLGHGDSIRDVIEVFCGNSAAKGVPPDRGQTLEDVLLTRP